jgi:hypothetical protein
MVNNGNLPSTIDLHVDRGVPYHSRGDNDRLQYLQQQQASHFTTSLHRIKHGVTTKD